MTKIYLCGFRRCCVTLNDGSSITFEDRSYGEFGSIYTTSDKREQELLEQSPLFGDVFTLHQTVGNESDDSKKENGETPEKETSLVETYADITRTQEAIALIKTTCQKRGIPYYVIRSKEKALEEAQRLGLSFPNLK